MLIFIIRKSTISTFFILYHRENVMSCKLATCGKRDDQSTIGQLSSVHSMIQKFLYLLISNSVYKFTPLKVGAFVWMYKVWVLIRIRHMLRKISKSSHISIRREVSADTYVCRICCCSCEIFGYNREIWDGS